VLTGALEDGPDACRRSKLAIRRNPDEVPIWAAATQLLKDRARVARVALAERRLEDDQVLSDGLGTVPFIEALLERGLGGGALLVG
jgi:hypothetical protein